MRKFEAGKSYEESCTTGYTSKIECLKVTAKTATFETVYGISRMKIRKDLDTSREVISTNYGTMILA